MWKMIHVLLLLLADTFNKIQVYLKLMNCNVNLKKNNMFVNIFLFNLILMAIDKLNLMNYGKFHALD